MLAAEQNPQNSIEIQVEMGGSRCTGNHGSRAVQEATHEETIWIWRCVIWIQNLASRRNVTVRREPTAGARAQAERQLVSAQEASEAQLATNSSLGLLFHELGRPQGAPRFRRPPPSPATQPRETPETKSTPIGGRSSGELAGKLPLSSLVIDLRSSSKYFPIWYPRWARLG